ncbi:MAG: CDP-diacylglycerol--serine O-phosphatidyltransferase [Hyphomicrobiaceae bacterium]
MPLDPILPKLEQETRRRRRIGIFRHRKVPVRMLVPNFFTLLGLCAGLTAIRMAIEHRYDIALAAIVIAALLDSVDGRIARLLKASSRFGAELDSLADFVNFGVAPAVVLYTWGYNASKGLGWIVVLIFAVASALRLARFNVAIDDEKPHWQGNYFTGMPVPAAAIVVMLPVYLVHLDLLPIHRALLPGYLVYTLLIAFLMVSTIPTFSGKLLGERIPREMVLPIFVVVGALVALLLTYPYATLTAASVVYLALVPVAARRFARHMRESEAAEARAQAENDGRLVDLRSPDEGKS